MSGLRPRQGELVVSRSGGQILGYGCQCSFQQSAGFGKWMESGQKRDGCGRTRVEALAGFRAWQPVRLPAMRGVLPGSRHGGEEVAASGLLAASHRTQRPGAAHQLPGTRSLASRGAMGSGWQRIYPHDGGHDLAAGPADERVGNGSPLGGERQTALEGARALCHGSPWGQRLEPGASDHD